VYGCKQFGVAGNDTLKAWIIVFHGYPDSTEAMSGGWEVAVPWYTKFYKTVKPTVWKQSIGDNCTVEKLNMILLKNREPIAASGSRACYLHPEDENKVIKIVRMKTTSRKKQTNWQEWKHYHYLLKQHGKLDFINECYGFITTDLGKGLVWQCVRDASGEISSTITNIMQSPDGYELEKVERALGHFCEFLIEKNIQLFDLNPGNVMIRIRPDGSYQAVSADIKGRYANYEFIPISTYIPFFSRRKLKRRCKELTDWYGRFLRNKEA